MSKHLSSTGANTRSSVLDATAVTLSQRFELFTLKITGWISPRLRHTAFTVSTKSKESLFQVKWHALSPFSHSCRQLSKSLRTSIALYSRADLCIPQVYQPHIAHSNRILSYLEYVLSKALLFQTPVGHFYALYRWSPHCRLICASAPSSSIRSFLLIRPHYSLFCSCALLA